MSNTNNLNVDKSKAFLNTYGPWALVTGASDGIGKSFAMALAKQGFNLMLSARRESLLRDISAELAQQYEVTCRYVAADLASEVGMKTLLNAASSEDIGLLVCSAGYGTSGNFLDQPIETELNMVELNCSSLTQLSWQLGQSFKRRGKGGLILLSSIVAFQGVPRSASYAATKAYVQTLGEGIANEWKDHGVDVLCVAPGPVNTGFAARSNLKISKADHPDTVAVQSLAALGKSTTVRPGYLGKLLGYALALTPRSIRIKIMQVVMRGMSA